MRYKKGNEYYDGKSIVYNGKRYISPSESILLEAGYVKEEPQVVEPTNEQMADDLRGQFVNTDWKIIKTMEYRLLGLPDPYNVQDLHNERQAIRDEINELESES